MSPRPTLEEEAALLRQLRRDQGAGQTRWYEMPLSGSRTMTLMLYGEPDVEEWDLAIEWLGHVIKGWREERNRLAATPPGAEPERTI